MSTDWGEYIERLKAEALRLAAFQPPKPDDAKILQQRVLETLRKVDAQVKPVAEAAIQNGSIHTEDGRKMFLLTVQKFFRDALREYNYDELIFITAFVLSEAVLDQYA